MSEARPPMLAVDAHVHFHPGWDAGAFLGAAAGNLARGAARCGQPIQGGVLLLAERRGSFDRERLQLALGTGRARGWRLTHDGPQTMVAERADAIPLLVVAGHQLATADGLEVLAIGLGSALQDGLPTDECCRRVAGAGALPVIPWSFGKWWSRRGELLRSLLRNPPTPWLCLGDSGLRSAPGRLRRRSPVMALAQRLGVPILAGSDPLPLRRDEGRVGSFGLLLAETMEAVMQWPGLRRQLLRQGGRNAPLGRRLDPVSSLGRQLSLRVRALGAPS